jgi:hypothetical protein
MLGAAIGRGGFGGMGGFGKAILTFCEFPYLFISIVSNMESKLS